MFGGHYVRGGITYGGGGGGEGGSIMYLGEEIRIFLTSLKLVAPDELQG